MKKAIAVFVVCCFVAAFADNPHITQLIELVDVAISSPVDGDVLTFSGATGKWGNKQPIAPVVTDGPKIILRYQQENINSPFPDTSFFVPNETGMYRVSIVVATLPRVSDNEPCVNGGAGAFVTYNGDVFTRLLPEASVPGSGAQAQNSGVVRATAGFPFIVTSSGTAGCPYSFYVTVEKI